MLFMKSWLLPQQAQILRQLKIVKIQLSQNLRQFKKKVDVWLLDKLSFIALTLFYLLVIVSSLIEAFNSDVGRMLFYVTIFFKAIP